MKITTLRTIGTRESGVCIQNLRCRFPSTVKEYVWPRRRPTEAMEAKIKVRAFRPRSFLRMSFMGAWSLNLSTGSI
jgi:hypothetical protein